MKGKFAVLCVLLAGLVACAQGMNDDDGAADDDQPQAVCGDNVCTQGETNASCPDDCEPTQASCGDGTCNGTETINTCPGDCGGGGGGGGGGAVCGDGTCNGTENSSSCPADCGAAAVCGDGNCNGGETATSCPADCTGGGGGGGTPGCGDFVCDVAGGECESLDFGCLFDCIAEPACGGGGGGATCDHDVCTSGGPLDASCGTCEAAVCAADDFCCTTTWDEFCVEAVATECPGTTCP
jgi:hypothetical protein